MRGKGFTSVQLVIVLLLLAATSVFAAIAVHGAVTTFKLNSAAARMIADVEYARNLACTHGEWYGILFQINPTNHYSVYKTDGIADTNVVDPVNPSQSLVVDVAGSLGGVVIGAVNVAGGNKVEFNPLGIPYDDKNGAPLAAAGTVTLSYGGSQKVIEIKKNTGRVGVQ